MTRQTIADPRFHFVFCPHFEKLDPNAGKHEVQEHGDQYNISNGLHSHKHTLDHMLQTQIHMLQTDDKSSNYEAFFSNYKTIPTYVIPSVPWLC